MLASIGLQLRALRDVIKISVDIENVKVCHTGRRLVRQQKNRGSDL